MAEHLRATGSGQNILFFHVIFKMKVWLFFLVVKSNSTQSAQLCMLAIYLQMAEKFYVRAGMPRAAVEMYTKANKYDAAHKVSKTFSGDQK